MYEILRHLPLFREDKTRVIEVDLNRSQCNTSSCQRTCTTHQLAAASFHDPHTSMYSITVSHENTQTEGPSQTFLKIKRTGHGGVEAELRCARLRVNVLDQTGFLGGHFQAPDKSGGMNHTNKE